MMENDNFTSAEWKIRKDSAYFIVTFRLQQHDRAESVISFHNLKENFIHTVSFEIDRK